MPAVETLPDDRSEHAVNLGSGLFRAAAIAEQGEPVEHKHRRRLDALLVAVKRVVDMRRARLIELHREDRAVDDVGGDMRHQRIDLDRLRPVERGDIGQQFVYCRLHRRIDALEIGVREGRVDHLALIFPVLAVGRENAVADQRIEQRVEEAVLGKHLLLVIHHCVDHRQVVGDEEIELGQANLAHLHRVAALEQRVDPAVPAGQEAFDQRGLALERNGEGGREQPFAFGRLRHHSRP